MSRAIAQDVRSAKRHIARDAGAATAVRVRRRIVVAGQVQGVGFRPFVYRLARSCGLVGAVRNDGGGVMIDASGLDAALDRFIQRLHADAPALARIDRLTVEPLAGPIDAESFTIVTSDSTDRPTAAITPDVALCADCRRELADPADRRFGYGLINCTNCGPRYSIVRDVPYDRPNTTMAGFTMCAACAGEYADPADRRFHAEPIACPTCGPRLELVRPTGRSLPGDPIDGAAELLRAGRIIAIKGLGGFHLAVRATDDAAVKRLRRLKRRDAKPFAVMARDIDAARMLVRLTDAGEAAMRCPAAPIVLAPKSNNTVSDAVAPGTHRLGVMLAYTPIHHLLFDRGGETLGPLVMTSANAIDEPLVIDNDEAVQRLAGLCDAMLWHDRPIERCVDDSVLLDRPAGAPLPVRRSRGYVPTEIALPAPATDGLCVGGELKNTIAVVRDGRAVLSQHLGDLKHPLALAYFQRAIDDLLRLTHTQPNWIAHDLHPAYLSTEHAAALAERFGVPLIGVQHHHAHAAAVLAEHGRTDRALAIVADGVGYGADGTIRGGELLAADLLDAERLTHLRPIRLPGGDAAARDTRRCALALMHQCLGDGFADHPMTRTLLDDSRERATLTTMLRRNVRCVETTAAGRVFDGVAALLGVCRRNDHEAQAAMALEAIAEPIPPIDAEPLFDLTDAGIDLSRLVRQLIHDRRAGVDSAYLAALFHDQLADAFVAATRRAAEQTGIDTVALSGGVMANPRLSQRLTDRLSAIGLDVLVHEIVPANDGGLALGQAAIAAARTAAGRPRRDITEGGR